MIARLRQRNDITACVRLLASVHATDGYPTRWPADSSSWLTPDTLLGHIALCGVRGDSAASGWAVASGLPPERMAEVARLFVAPDARGQGIGATLLETARSEADSRGLRPVLKVLERDRSAIALYERLGWRRVATIRAPWVVARDNEALLHFYLAPE